MSIEMVRQWVKKFQEKGRTIVHGTLYSGPPSLVVNANVITAVRAVADGEWHATISDIKNLVK